MHALRHTIAVDIQNHLDGRIILQDPVDPIKSVCIGPAAVELSVPQIINICIMDDMITARR